MTNTATKFWNRVDKSGGPEACWPWTGYRCRRGYGQVSMGGRVRKAHRVALEVSGVAVPTNAEACHRCDNPSCCNPAHLFVGTRSDNMRDMVAKGRAAPFDPSIGRLARPLRGSANPASRLTPEQVLRIRGELGARSHVAIAADHGVTRGTISQIARGKIWSWL